MLAALCPTGNPGLSLAWFDFVGHGAAALGTIGLQRAGSDFVGLGMLVDA